MQRNNTAAQDRKNDGDFLIEGRAQLDGADKAPADLSLTAYAFDRLGRLLGSGDVNADGNFRLSTDLTQPDAVELVISPPADPETVRRSAAYSEQFAANDWQKSENGFRLNPQILVDQDIWLPWRPIRVCVTGHVRKVHTVEDRTDICPVPFVQVEIFDVDREYCWWPYIRRWWDVLLDRPVFRIPELLKERLTPLPFPLPDPIGPVSRFDFARQQGAGIVNPGTLRGFNPQPDPPRLSGVRIGDTVSLNPQPLPPREISQIVENTAALRVGEARFLEPQIATRLDNLTLSSVVAPWRIFPRCFYSRRVVCTTTTDCNGYFKCCFRWPRFHFRQGRLRFDARPDIIVRVTQTINGVSKVIYLDPYTSTRWDVNNAHIDLFLDNDDVQCGSGCDPDRPEGTATFFTRVGLDEVYKIHQSTGTYDDTPYGGGLSNVAYGGSLRLYGLFGTALSTGAPARYYRLSLKKGSGDFVALTTGLADTRVNKVTFDTEIHSLGPQPVNGVPNLYEIRDTAGYYWYNPDWIGLWNTETDETDEGLYTVRLEVFNELGVALTSADVDYRDGTVAPPGPLPSVTDHCDLVVQVDNKYPTVDLQIPAAAGDCGVVPFSAAATLSLLANVNQENGRLYSWNLSYVKGLTGVSNGLGGNSSGSGLAVPVNQSVSGAPMTAGLTGTCAFSLTLSAWPLVRNGFSFIHYQDVTKAIAIEKCDARGGN